jgi:hypothetical protein
MARAPSKTLSRVDIDDRLDLHPAAGSSRVLRRVDEPAAAEAALDVAAPEDAWSDETGFTPPTVPTLSELIRGLEASSSSSVLLSLACDPSLDSGGMAALVRLYGHCMITPGRRLYLRHVSADFRRELARVGLDGLIPVLD